MQAEEEFKEVSEEEMFREIVRRLSLVKPESTHTMLNQEAN